MIARIRLACGQDRGQGERKGGHRSGSHHRARAQRLGQLHQRAGQPRQQHTRIVAGALAPRPCCKCTRISNHSTRCRVYIKAYNLKTASACRRGLAAFGEMQLHNSLWLKDVHTQNDFFKANWQFSTKSPPEEGGSRSQLSSPSLSAQSGSPRCGI